MLCCTLKHMIDPGWADNIGNKIDVSDIASEYSGLTGKLNTQR